MSQTIKDLQAGGIDYFGNPLVIDGINGPKTEWWTHIRQFGKTRQDFLRIALGYHAAGMSEIYGNSINNDGIFVDRCLKPAGLKNKPWCIAFISLCLREAGIPWKTYHVSAYRLLEWAEHHRLFVDDPAPGDLFAFLYPRVPGEDWKGHGGIITGLDLTDSENYFNSVDGNIADAVRSGRRSNRPGLKFIRIPEMGPASPVVIKKTLMKIDTLGDR